MIRMPWQGRPGLTLGAPAASLGTAKAWAVDEKVGDVAAAGELRTAKALDAAAGRRGGFTVLHDLTLPGSRANIDHVVVFASNVLLLDTKVWAAGRYVTQGGVTTRDGQPFPAADSPTLAQLAVALTHLLAATGAHMMRPRLLVWPSPVAPTPPDLAQVRAPGVEVCPAPAGLAALSGRSYRRPADLAIVRALVRFVVDPSPEGLEQLASDEVA